MRNRTSQNQLVLPAVALPQDGYRCWMEICRWWLVVRSPRLILFIGGKAQWFNFPRCHKQHQIQSLIQFFFLLPSGKLTWLWKITIFNGKIHYKWSFSIAMLNYQRVFYCIRLYLSIPRYIDFLAPRLCVHLEFSGDLCKCFGKVRYGRKELRQTWLVYFWRGDPARNAPEICCFHVLSIKGRCHDNYPNLRR